MKKILSLLSLAALTIGLLGSCSKINERIDSLDKRVYDLENNKIASIEQQITAINASINDLKAADVTINGKITELKTTAEAQQTLIDALKEADEALGQKDTELEARIATLEGQVATMNGQIKALEEADKAILVRIDELRTYIDTEIGKTKDWAEEAFATLEQYQQTADDLAALSVTVTGISTTLTGIQTRISGLDTKIDGIDADLQDKIASAKTELEGKITSLKTELEGKIATAIGESETSIKTWINGKLGGYYTAAVVDEKIDALNTALEASKSTAKTRIDSLATELTKTKAAVDTAKANIRTEYKKAIDEAINKLDGEIRGALLDSIAAVNGRIEALDTRVTTLEGKVLTLEGNVNKLLAMIQSVSITPAYSDGSVEAVNGILTLKCIVSPAEALIGMESLKDSLLIYADSVKVKTKATTPAYMTIEVSEASVLDAAQGAITLTADISEYLPKGEDKALTVAVNIKNGISDFTTEFVPVYAVIGPAAKIGETTYATLAEAIAAVADNGTITLLKNITNATGIELPAGKGFTMDLSGYTYTVGGPGAGTPATSAFETAQETSIIFKNGTICCSEGNKSKTGTEGISTVIRNNGSLSFININIDGTNLAKDGENDGTLIINNNNIGSIEGGTYTNDGPVLVSESGIVNVGGADDKKVTFTSNNNTAIIVKNSQVTLKDGVYTGAEGVVSFPGTDNSKIDIESGTYNSADYPVLWGDKNGKNNTVTVKGGTINATATGDNVPCGIFSPGNDEIIVKSGIFNVPGEDASADGGTGVTVLSGKLTVKEEEGTPAPKFNVGKTEGTGKVLGIDVNRGYSITVNKNYGTPDITADPEKYPQGIIVIKKTMAEILNTTTGIPESNNLTPPANAWVKKTDKECKAFVGIDAEGDKLFVILKAGQELAPLGLCMDDDFEKIDDNTYKRVEESVGTFTIKMTGGKFTSYEFAAVSGSAYEQFNGTYSAPAAPTEYTVTFDLNGISGTAPEAQKIEENSNVTKPTDPTDLVHTFAGWYKTKDATTGALSEPWDFDNGTVTADMTLYAQWTRTLESIYSNSDIPKATNNSAPDNAWVNGNGGKAFIAFSTGNTVLYLYKQLQPSGAKQLSCRKTENFTKIGDDYVLFYELQGKQYGVYTLHMTEGIFTSVTYNGAGTDYEVLSGTYAAPTADLIILE